MSATISAANAAPSAGIATSLSSMSHNRIGAHQSAYNILVCLQRLMLVREPHREPHGPCTCPPPQVSDMSVSQDHVIGCSFHNSFVGVWVVDMKHVNPFNQPGYQESAAAAEAGGDQGASDLPYPLGHLSQLESNDIFGIPDAQRRPAPAAQQPPRFAPSVQSTAAPTVAPPDSYLKVQQSAPPMVPSVSAAAPAQVPQSAPLAAPGHRGMVAAATETGQSLYAGAVAPGQLAAAASAAASAEHMQQLQVAPGMAAAAARPPRPGPSPPRGGFPAVEIRVPAGGPPLQRRLSHGEVATDVASYGPSTSAAAPSAGQNRYGLERPPRPNGGGAYQGTDDAANSDVDHIARILTGHRKVRTWFQFHPERDLPAVLPRLIPCSSQNSFPSPSPHKNNQALSFGQS